MMPRKAAKFSTTMFFHKAICSVVVVDESKNLHTDRASISSGADDNESFEEWFSKSRNQPVANQHSCAVYLRGGAATTVNMVVLLLKSPVVPVVGRRSGSNDKCSRALRNE